MASQALLVAVVAVGGLAAALLAGTALAAYLRRRSRSYLLVGLALAALVARAMVAGVTMLGAVDPGTHHLLEHGLDVVMAALVVGAVYYARSVEAGTRGGPREQDVDAGGFDATGAEAADESREVRS
jgi:hypothetical protein